MQDDCRSHIFTIQGLTPFLSLSTIFDLSASKKQLPLSYYLINHSSDWLLEQINLSLSRPP
jgi:hypothetical protein